MAKKLVELELTESSLVDVPANPGAKLTLFKRGVRETETDDVAPVVKTVGDNDTPKSALKRAFGMIAKALGMDAESFAETHSLDVADNALWDMVYNLRRSIRSILEDASITDKGTAIAQSISQFATAFAPYANAVQSAQQQSITVALSKLGSVVGIIETFTKVGLPVDVLPTDEIEKALDELEVAVKSPEEPEGSDLVAEGVVKTDPQAEPTAADVEKAELQKRLEDLEKRAKDAEDLAKAERDKRVEAEFVKRAEGYGTLPESPETLGPIMKRASENTLTDDDFEKLEAVLKAAGEALDKSDLFKSLGSDGDGDTSAVGQYRAAVAKAKEDNPDLTDAAASVEAFKSLPADVQAKVQELDVV